MRFFLDVILQISERSGEPALRLERETYVLSEAVLILDGTENDELVPGRSFLLMRYFCCLSAVLHLQVAIEWCF